MSSYSFNYDITPVQRLAISFDYSPGRPGVHTLRNGDPGYPDEPAELYVEEVAIWRREDENSAWQNTGVVLPTELIEENAWLESICGAEVERMESDAAAEEAEARERERDDPPIEVWP